MGALTPGLADCADAVGDQIRAAVRNDSADAMILEERARNASAVLCALRLGRKPAAIARAIGLPERHVLRILDAYRLIGVDTRRMAPGEAA